MEKSILIELQPTGVKMTVEKLMGGAFHKKVDEISDVIRFDEDIFENGDVSDDKFKECIKLLEDYKAIAAVRGITKIYAYASSIFHSARNHKKFFDDIFKRTSLFFNILSEEEEMRMIYNSMVGTLDTVKGILVYVNSHNTYVMNFAKRSLMGCYTLPFGANSLAVRYKEEGKGATKKIIAALQKYVAKEIVEKKIEFEPFDELKFVGSGPMFLNISKLVRKITHYPLDLDQNYYVTKENLDKAFDVLMEQGFDRTKRLANISNERVDNILCGALIMKVFAEIKNVDQYNITDRGITEAIIANKIVRESSCDNTPTDPLEMSIKNARYYYPVDESNAENIYNLTIELFQQMTIVHKLSRKQVKAIKIAANMYDCGKRITAINHMKYSRDIILHSGLLNVSHKDLIVASFACQLQNPDNFNLADWVRYKDIVNEEDLMNARKIGGLVALAVALDASKQSKIKELDCDLLGDIVIVKTRSDTDASYEVNETAKLGNMLKKIFGKSFQVM